MFERTGPFNVIEADGYISNARVRAAYERLADSSAIHGGDRAEAFLRFVEKCAARGVRLYAQ